MKQHSLIVCDCLQNVYFHPISAELQSRFESSFKDFCDIPAHVNNNNNNNNIIIDGKDHRATTVSVYGHKLRINWLVNGRRSAKFSFSELCSEAYGAADFIALAQLLSTVAIKDVEQFQITNRNEASSSVILLDCVVM